MPPRPLPDGAARCCFLALADLGTGSAEQIGQWLAKRGRRYTAKQVSAALTWLSTQARLPLIELTGTPARGLPGLWRLTARGRYLLAAEIYPPKGGSR
jgi:hypothetical protein